MSIIMSFRAFGQCVIVDSPFNKNIMIPLKLKTLVVAIELQNRYFEQTGEISFLLWTFAGNCVQLANRFNKEKAENLLGKMKALSTTPLWEKATKEQEEDLNNLTTRLEELINEKQ